MRRDDETLETPMTPTTPGEWIEFIFTMGLAGLASAASALGAAAMVLAPVAGVALGVAAPFIFWYKEGIEGFFVMATFLWSLPLLGLGVHLWDHLTEWKERKKGGSRGHADGA